MAFEPAKSSLLHFCRARAGRLETVRLGRDVVTPQESTRFLGVMLDRKLRFTAHKKHIINRLSTQKFALSCIAAKTWGPSLLQALAVYKVVIRSVMTYAASAFITAAEWKGRGSSLARRLASEQNDCLRRVTGAYKSTPTAMLEELTGCPPINLVLTK